MYGFTRSITEFNASLVAFNPQRLSKIGHLVIGLGRMASNGEVPQLETTLARSFKSFNMFMTEGSSKLSFSPVMIAHNALTVDISIVRSRCIG